MNILAVFVLAAFLAGLSICWQVFLNDHPRLKEKIRAKSTFFVCGVCQTFWGSLALSFFFNPLAGIELPTRTPLPAAVAGCIALLLTWQLLGVLSCVIRYLALLLIESLKYLIKKNT